jgi:hypothetical protein
MVVFRVVRETVDFFLAAILPPSSSCHSISAPAALPAGPDSSAPAASPAGPELAFLLVVTNPHGKRRGIFHARTLDGRPIGTGHLYPLCPFDPQQFMLKHKLRIHYGPGAAGIHEKVPFTLVVLQRIHLSNVGWL